MIYTAKKFGSAAIKDEIEQKQEWLNRIVAAYCCSHNGPMAENIDAIANYLDVIREQFRECKLPLVGNLKADSTI